MDDHLAHTPWRVVHTDPFTPEAFSAHLALDGYAEQPAVIQMVLSRQLQAVPGSDITPIETEADWRALAALVRRDHEEVEIGRDTSELQSLMRISYAVFCLNKNTKKCTHST